MNYSKAKSVKKIVIGVIIGLAALIIFLCSTVSIPAGHTGVLLSFGEVQDYTLDSGFHFKAPWMTVVKMDNRIQKETQELSCFSSDIQEVSVKYTVNFQINQNNAMTIYKTIGVYYYDKVISPAITESAKIVTAQYTAENLVSKRDELAIEIEKVLAEKLEKYNIILVATSIENMDFTDAFTTAVEEKQVAQQEKLKAQTQAEQKVIEAQAQADVKVIEAQADADAKLIDAQADADAKLIEAEAEAEANKKIAESITDAILEKMYYEKWDGQLPTYYSGSGDETTMISIPTKDTK